MALPWVTLERVETADGVLELRQRDRRDFLILLDGRVVMNSRAHRSETALAERALRGIGPGRPARVLIGGLGMGFTLRAALDRLAPAAKVVLAELNAAVVQWCRGPLAHLSGHALADPRVALVQEDVAVTVRHAAAGGADERFDVILFDLYEGPRADAGDHPLYGDAMLAALRNALQRNGVFAVWSEQACPPFGRRLAAAGFDVEMARPGRGGLRHAVYVARRRP